MGYEVHLKYIKKMKARLSDEQVFSILQQYGPHNDEELSQQIFRFEQTLGMYVFSIVHCIALAYAIPLLYRIIDMTDTSLIRFIGAFLSIAAISYTFYGGGEFQSKFFFREKHLLSVYRRISFLEAYPMYAVLGLVLGTALAVLIDNGPWALLTDYDKTQRTIALMFGVVNLLASVACILRFYFQEANNVLTVRDWMMKSKDSGKSPLEQTS